MYSTQLFNHSTNDSFWVDQSDKKPQADKTRGSGSLNGVEVTRENGQKYLSRTAVDQAKPPKTSIMSRIARPFKVAGSYIKSTIKTSVRNAANLSEKVGKYVGAGIVLGALCPITAPLTFASVFLQDSQSARLLGSIASPGESLGGGTGRIVGGIAGAAVGLALTPIAGMIGLVRGAVSLIPASHSARA
ncbi:hypothetical protein [Endozoicomonas lisbonensis]|uniref:DUF456 domain-containing protein n=1 Tax=Endozoicomonas lisbonensis TaxID=3120522 RepID=A0ABV2SKF5_9GAMM